MNQYILLLRSLFLYYLIAFAILCIGTGHWFIDTPLWVSLVKLVISLINCLVIHVFNQAINVLPDED
jgi:hypothetical protein